MTAAILQARMSSSRLPNKVLLPILGRPMLARQVERIQRAKCVDRLIVATSTGSNDDSIAGLAADLDVACYRGSLDDVLDRYYQAAKQASADHVIRLTGDCPLADPDLIDRVFEFYLENHFDYASNARVPAFHDGLDVEVFSFKVLEQAWREAVLPSHREHVTFFMSEQPKRFSLGDYNSGPDLSFLRWTVDNREDFDLVLRIYESLYPQNPEFTTADILALLEREPAVKTLNSKYVRNAGWEPAFKKDREWFSKNQ